MTVFSLIFKELIMFLNWLCSCFERPTKYLFNVVLSWLFFPLQIAISSSFLKFPSIKSILLTLSQASTWILFVCVSILGVLEFLILLSHNRKPVKTRSALWQANKSRILLILLLPVSYGSFVRCSEKQIVTEHYPAATLIMLTHWDHD